MSEKESVPMQMPAWLREAPPEVRESGWRLYCALIPMLEYRDAPKYLSGELKNSDYGQLGILHQACVGYEMAMYRVAKESVIRAATTSGASKEHPHGANKGSFRKVYGMLRVQEQNRFDRGLIYDALSDAISEGSDAGGNSRADGAKELTTWLSIHPGVSPGDLIPYLVTEHLERRHRDFPELDPVISMRMPKRAVDAEWYGPAGEKFVLWELDEKDLIPEGILMRNCVGEDRWGKQARAGKTRIFSLGVEFPEGTLVREQDARVEYDLYNDKIAPHIDWDSVDINDMHSSFQDNAPQQVREKISAWAEKIAATRVCRFPKVTIEYDAESLRIMQIEASDNSKVDPSSPLADVVVDAVMALSEKVHISDVLNAGDEFERRIMLLLNA